MTGSEMTKRALEKLPPRIAESCRNTASLYGGRINEIRLRKGSPASLTIRGENIVLGISATEAELEESVRTFCESSLYSHADTICSGYIAAAASASAYAEEPSCAAEKYSRLRIYLR